MSEPDENMIKATEPDADEQASDDRETADHEATAATGDAEATRETDKENSARRTGEARRLTPAMSDEEAKREMSRRTRRAFLVGGVAALAGYGGYRWLRGQEDIDGIAAPFRRAHEFNERLSQAYFSPERLVREFPRTLASEPRINGLIGMPEGFNPASWRLQVTGVAEPTKYAQYRDNIAYDIAADDAGAGDASTAELVGANSDESNSKEPDNKVPGLSIAERFDRMAKELASENPEPGLVLTLEDIKRLPRVEMTTRLKCIEGWSTIVYWAGARLADFIAAYQPPTRNGSAPDVRNRPADLVRYVSLVTPDGGYYVGLDMASALHPQTLLCYEMNGAPLTLEHGAPLRLYIPVKYGIKSLKRIGRITFTDTRPADLWAERGYDWYSGH